MSSARRNGRVFLSRYPITGRSLEWFFGIDEDLFERQYKRHLSGYRQWKDTAEGQHAEQWRVFPENIEEHLSIDVTLLSNDFYCATTHTECVTLALAKALFQLQTLSVV